MNRGAAPRALTVVALVATVASAVGFFAMLMLNPFVFDEYDAYGEVPIPGSSSLELPAGDVTVSFHTILIGGSGSGLPVPPLKYTITGPDGDDVTLAQDYGSTTTVNNDARVRIGYLHLARAGTYEIRLDGGVSAYLDPTLAFGHGSPYRHVPWILAAVFGVAALCLVAARIWAARVRRTEPVPGYQPPPTLGSVPTWTPDPTWTPSYAPTDQGIRIEQLNTLARLRDSGALTEEEYEAEKKRVLDGL